MDTLCSMYEKGAVPLSSGEREETLLASGKELIWDNTIPPDGGWSNDRGNGLNGPLGIGKKIPEETRPSKAC